MENVVCQENVYIWLISVFILPFLLCTACKERHLGPVIVVQQSACCDSRPSLTKYYTNVMLLKAIPNLYVLINGFARWE